MLSNAARIALLDIKHHIALVGQFTQGFTAVTLEADLRTLYAVTRCLEIISEASRRVPDELKALHPEIAWKNMAAAGNVYRHDYEDVTPVQIWEAVQLALPPLQAVVEAELAA